MRSSLVLVAAMLASAPAFAQDAFPSRPITMIVAFPPGGVADITARPTAFAMEKVLKQRVIIENKPGAAGATGNAYVANSKPDGYTLLMALSSISVIPEAERLQGKKPPYELAQFAPIALISADPVVLVVREESPWKSLKDFVQDAKSRPGKISYSSSGIFGALHMPYTLLEHATGITLWHVPYNGGGPAVQALLGGQVDSTVGGPAAMIGQIKGKRFRPLAPGPDRAVDPVGGEDQVRIPVRGEVAHPFCWYSSVTPRLRHRRCRMSRRSCRDIPAKPWPVEVTTVPRQWMSMSSQWAKARAISSCVSRSAWAKCSRVASEKTTPNPNVSSARFRSTTVTSCAGSAFFMRAAK